jgi:hypothetical protein
MRFDGREGDAIYSGYTVVFFGQLIRVDGGGKVGHGAPA